MYPNNASKTLTGYEINQTGKVCWASTEHMRGRQVCVIINSDVRDGLRACPVCLHARPAAVLCSMTDLKHCCTRKKALLQLSYPGAASISLWPRDMYLLLLLANVRLLVCTNHCLLPTLAYLSMGCCCTRCSNSMPDSTGAARLLTVHSTTVTAATSRCCLCCSAMPRMYSLSSGARFGRVYTLQSSVFAAVITAV